jgi:signal transduction histidine kinase
MINDLQPVTGDTVKIMITDDDAADRMQIRRALKQTGLPFECVEASNIDEAGAACEQQAFDCAFVDYRLPGIDGLDGLSALHELRPHMFIVMATGHGDAVVATEAMKRGASDYIGKEHITGKSLGRIIEHARQKQIMRRKLGQQQEELERFADVLVHDLKSPITSIRGFATAIKLAVQSGAADASKIAGYCERVVAQGERMVALLDTLLEYTKSDAKVDFGPVDLNGVVADALSNLEQVVSKRCAVVTHAELPLIFGHAALLTQLLQNLIGNGIKYCEAHPPTVHISAQQDEQGSFRVSVRDNGIGIDAEFHQQIFEPFKRLQHRGKYEGTGLGLATCRKIVERHGGRIWCESNRCEGTTFHFILPAVSGHPDQMQESN